MSRVQNIRVFARQRLHAALEDILAVWEKTILKYEEEAALNREVIARQHALLCALHKPTADAFTQQQLLSGPEVPPQDQGDPDPLQSALDSTDIIQFTYSCQTSAPLGEGGGARPQLEVTLLSSETEDSEDYGRDHSPPGVRSLGGAALSCHVCSRTFTARHFLSRHIKAHGQDAVAPGGGLGGDAQGLKLHVQTPLEWGRTPQSQTRARTRARTRIHRGGGGKHRKPSEEGEEGGEPREEGEEGGNTENPVRRERRGGTQRGGGGGVGTHRCDDCGRTFLQLWRKRKHRCRPLMKKKEEEVEFESQSLVF